MRKIKFRAKMFNGQWAYGSLTFRERIGWGLWWADESFHNFEDCSQSILATNVWQATSYEDKNGTPIFEGDIIEDAWYVQSKQLLVVVYDEICDGFVAQRIGDDNAIELFNFDTDSLTIVGNTTDNPELLQQ